MERATGKFETTINIKEAKIPIFTGSKSFEQSMKIIQASFIALAWWGFFFLRNMKYTLITCGGVFVLLMFPKQRNLKYISTFSKLQSLFGGNFYSFAISPPSTGRGLLVTISKIWQIFLGETSEFLCLNSFLFAKKE